MSTNGDTYLGPDQADDGREDAADLTVSLADAPLASDGPAPQASTRQRQGGFRRWAVVAALGLVVLVLLGGRTVSALVLNASATVTITPRSSDLKQTFTLTGVTGTPNASRQQVGVQAISVTTPAKTKTVPATGQGTTPGTPARFSFYMYIIMIARTR